MHPVRLAENSLPCVCRTHKASWLCADFVLLAVEVALEMNTIDDCGELFAWVEAHLSGGLVRCYADNAYCTAAPAGRVRRLGT